MGMGSPENRRKADGSYRTQERRWERFVSSDADRGEQWLDFRSP
jgi:hypothetical protein